MFLRTDEYLPYAPDDIGRTVRVNHSSSECTGGSKSMVVERKEDGVYAKCFRCGAYGRNVEGKPRHFFTKEKAAWAGRATISAVTMPRDSSTTLGSWPSKARAWIGRGRVTSEEVGLYGLSYSPSLGRVIIPIESNGELVGYQARKIHDEDEGPKYYTRTTDPTKMVFTASGLSNPDWIVLCEDVLSAIRISRFMPSCAILGTELSDYALNRLTTNKKYGIVYLDYDNRIVKKKSRLLKNRLELLLSSVDFINNGLDPKTLSDIQLSVVLNKYLI